MSIAELKELRKTVVQKIGHADENVVKKVYKILVADEENGKPSSFLTPEQEAILDECMELDSKGLMEYSSWEEARARIISKK